MNSSFLAKVSQHFLSHSHSGASASGWPVVLLRVSNLLVPLGFGIEQIFGSMAQVFNLTIRWGSWGMHRAKEIVGVIHILVVRGEKLGTALIRRATDNSRSLGHA